MIPRIIHFIWIKDGSSFGQSNLQGILSAVENTTCKLVLHTDDPDIEDISGVEIRRRVFDTTIKGIPLDACRAVKSRGGEGKRISHIKDIYRLDILYEEGGIYSDLDVLWLRNPWEFWNKKVVIGYTNKSYKILANAVIMAEAGHPALMQYKQWLLDIYPCKKYWIPANPYKLWKNNPDVCMLDKYYFYPCRYDESEFSYEKIQKCICIHAFASMQDSSIWEAVRRGL